MSYRLQTLAEHKRIHADVAFRCQCGVEKVVRAGDLIKEFRPTIDPNAIARRMRCRSCGKRTVFAFAVLPDHVVQIPLPFKAIWFGGAYDPEKID
ncbi:hypothetical protein [Ferrovibrio terrae]|uniref:hypothetical protein n=1 Tax=Ferrovibrio terrae TaxID=2594003 RepID=UPI0031379C24